MLALNLHNDQLDLRFDFPTPVPVPGEALLRVRLAGICGTDMALIQGYKGGYSGVLGHEYVAEVVQAPGREEWVGRRVVGEINTSCGQCDHCRRGLVTHCQRRRVLGILNWDGAFAEYMLSPTTLLHAVPDHVPDEVAVFTEPVAAAYAALRDIPPDAGERIVVFGDGRLGLVIALAFVAEGYDPVLVGRHVPKLEIASRQGVRTTMELPAGAEFDVAVDATGRVEALSVILDYLRPRGTLILKTTTAQPGVLDLSRIVVNELRVIGSRCGPFPRALAALSTGRLDPRPLISATYSLSNALQAFAHAMQPGALKVLLRP
ncbi:MAG TPA: alcohol dehydrogenase catalytic domain-containing protein [Caldilineae bacterium]|nr:alcohol dehydrogenase catalytic domain-containing protein [Caldilineae bacterium]